MTALEKFVESEYNDKRILLLLKKYGLLQSINNTIEIIEKWNKNSDELNLISSNTLKIFNDILRTVDSEKDRKEIEKKFLELSIKLIAYQFRFSLLKSKEFVKNIKQALQTTCELNGYNFHELHRLLNFDKLEELLNNIPKRKRTSSKNETYCSWNKDENTLKRLCSKLEAERIIINTQALKELLLENEIETQVIYEKKNLNTFIILFRLLIDKRYILSKNGKGFWKFISVFFTDINGKSVKEKTLANRHAKMTNDRELETHRRHINKANEIMQRLLT